LEIVHRGKTQEFPVDDTYDRRRILDEINEGGKDKTNLFGDGVQDLFDLSFQGKKMQDGHMYALLHTMSVS